MIPTCMRSAYGVKAVALHEAVMADNISIISSPVRELFG
jgi:hypothetical protein